MYVDIELEKNCSTFFPILFILPVMLFDRVPSCSIAGSKNMTETFIVSKHESPGRDQARSGSGRRLRRTLVTKSRRQTEITCLLSCCHSNFPVFWDVWVAHAGGCDHVSTCIATIASVRKRGITVRWDRRPAAGMDRLTLAQHTSQYYDKFKSLFS